MAIDVTNPDYYAMFNNNFNGSFYRKTGDIFVGRFDRDQSYVSEILVDADISGLSGTINSVEITFTIVDNNLGSTGTFVEVRENDKGSFTDNPGTSPTYDNRTSSLLWSTSSWPSSLATSTVVATGSSGSRTIASTAALVQLFQDWVDAVKTNNGFMLTMNTSFFDFFMTVNPIEISVDFDGVGTRVISGGGGGGFF